ncbi:MAG: Cysteine desulfurase [Ignavibacteriae bacterium]|nr:MAG: Cysteine desulfurase [Ignavibacteriota bacterium]
MNLNHIRDQIIGVDIEVPCLDGQKRKYVYLDNAASTPAFKSVLNCIRDFLPYYSGVHRGTGFKSLLSTELFDSAHEIAGKFVNANLKNNTVIFVKNTTEAVNKLAARLGLERDDIVITTMMEHHSNDLPWRKFAKVIHVKTDSMGYLDLNHLEDLIKKHYRDIKLVAISGASNITGYINPIYQIAKLAHGYGIKIFVDAAQLIPHRRFDVLPDESDEHIDFVAFSAHKMYAPFGTGVLIGPNQFFEKGDPDIVGGGVVEIVTLDEVYWTHPPFKEEAGSPNVIGGVALARAILQLQEFSMDYIADHEKKLLEYTYNKLKKIPDIELYGDTNNLANKVGVIPFNIKNMHHALTASILSFEGGIGVRNGCFCAHPYVKHLLKLSQDEEFQLISQIQNGDKSNLPGMVRASFGCYNNEDDVDRFVQMLERIVKNDYQGKYILNQHTGTYTVQGFDINLKEYFPFHPGKTSYDGKHYPESA